MTRTIKILLLAVGGLLGLVVAAVLAVALLVDPNDYRERIASEVETRTGRTFSIDGDLELAVFPWLRITSGPMVLGNAPGFDDGPFARIEGMSAGIRLWPLLRREIEIGTVRLVGLELNLEIDAAGRSNWEDLAPAVQDEPAVAGPDPQDPGSGPGSGDGIAGLRIAGVEIRSANVRYRDAAAGQQYALEDFNLTLDAVVLGQPVTARFDFGFSQQQPALTARIEGRSSLLVDDGFERIRLNDVRLDTRVDGGAGAPLEALWAELRIASAEAPLGAEHGSAAGAAGAAIAPERAPLDGLRLTNVELRNAGLRHRDDSGQLYTLDNLTLTLDEVVAGAPIDVRFGMHLEQQAPSLQGRLDGRMRLAVDAALEGLELRDLNLTTSVDGGAGAAVTSLQGELRVAATDLAWTGGDDGLEGMLNGLRVAGVELRDGGVQMRDEGSGQVYTLEGLTVTLDELVAGRASSLRFETRLAQQDPALSGRIQGGASVLLDAPGQTLRLQNLALETDLTGQSGAPLEALTARLQLASADVSLAHATHRASGLSASAELRDSALPGGGLAGRLAVAGLSADASAGTAEVQAIEIETAGVVLHASLEAAGLDREAAVITGTFDVPQFSPRRTLEIMEIPYQPRDEAVLERASARGALHLDGEDLRVSGLALTLDETTLGGEFSWIAERLEFDLDLGVIDLDRYLPPAAEDAPDEEGTLDEVEIPAEMLRGIAARGELRGNRIRLAGLEFLNLVVGLEADAGQLRLHPLTAGLFDGRYAGDIRLDVREGVEPHLTLDEQLENVQLGALMRALYEQQHATGRVDGRFQLAAVGDTVGEMRRSMDGQVSLAMREGAWEGVDMRHELRRAQALARQQAAPARTGAARTEFNDVRFTGRIQDGVMGTDDLTADLRFMQLAGEGGVNLNEGTLDYRFNARMLDHPDLAGDGLLSELRGAQLPLRIDGALTSPRIQPDLGALVRDQVIDRLRDEALRRLLPGGGGTAPQGTAPPEGGAGPDTEQPEAPPEAQPQTPTRPQDLLRRGVRDLLGN